MWNISNIILIILISILTSLGVWRFYINWQYGQSTAGHRLKNIIEAMLIIFEIQPDENALKDELLNKYQHSLAHPFYRMFLAFGLDEQANTKVQSYPLFCFENMVSGWSFFKEAVWPSMVDINNNSFIGWLPGVPNVERLLTVQETCFQIERVIGAFEHLRSLEKKHHIQVILPIHQDMYALEANPLVINDVQNLLAENNKLHELWQHWVRLIKKYRFNKQKKLMA